MPAITVLLLAFATLQAPDTSPTTVRAFVFAAPVSGADRTEEEGRREAVRDVREALAKKKGITLVDDRASATLLVEVLGREQRAEGTGPFGGKTITRMGDTIIRLRVKSGDDESDLKGMGQGTWGRAAKDAADRVLKWIARREPKRQPAASALAAVRTPAAGLVRTATPSAKPLEIYFIDVEGGQATLFVTPSGESMLIDTGYPGFADRDVNRVLAAIRQAGLTRLDYLLVTHYHTDHAGNAAAIAAKVPVRTFIDHGESVETDASAKALYADYLKGRASGRHMLAKPGDRIPLRDLDVTIVAAAGQHITRPLAGPARPTAPCAAFTPKEADPSENARSIGSVIAFGRFRMIDLGDLTWNKEQELVCPNNLLGTVDLYLTTHHGLDQSNAPVILQALRPRVAIMNNGPNKGGSAAAMRAIRALPGLEDFWQLHYSVDAGKDANSQPATIANLDESAAHGIKVTAQRDGSFTVTNGRTGETRRYAAGPGDGRRSAVAATR
jgi:competence protein ComEC